MNEPDVAYLNLLQEMPATLLFIMGCHRSGTSLLHHLLAYTGQFNYLSLYDILHYDELLSNRIHGNETQVKAALHQTLAALNDRSFDHLPVGVEYPEEYRFLLSELHISLSLRVTKRTELFAPHLTVHTLDRFLEICRKKQFLAQEKKPLLLKNPNDFYCHFMNISTMLPAARFIFIHRHPLVILNSHLLSFRSLLQAESDYWGMLDPGYRRLFNGLPFRRIIVLWAIRTEWYVKLVLSQLIRSFQYYLEQIKILPQECYLAIKYEDLCRDPEGIILQIGQRFEMDIIPRIPENFIRPRNLSFLQSTTRQYRRQLDALKPYLEAMNYPLWI